MVWAEVFLDLKYHDIPNTVKGAAYAAAQLGVYLFNVHASGGLKMMHAALEGAKEASAAHHLRLPKIIGVTVLTSIDQHDTSYGSADCRPIGNSCLAPGAAHAAGRT
jgi:orotidine-5'-phosphate decarboxylase